jgi:hypothetical protein
MHFDLNLLGQFTAQIINVDAGAAIDLGRVFARKQADSQRIPLVRSKTPSSIAAALAVFPLLVSDQQF